MVELHEIKAAAEAKAKAAAEALRLEMELRELIQQAMASGNFKLKELMDATGLSKQRIYQIRDGRR